MPESNEAIHRTPDLSFAVIGAKPGKVELAPEDDGMSNSSWRTVRVARWAGGDWRAFLCRGEATVRTRWTQVEHKYEI